LSHQFPALPWVTLCDSRRWHLEAKKRLGGPSQVRIHGTTVFAARGEPTMAAGPRAESRYQQTIQSNAILAHRMCLKSQRSTGARQSTAGRTPCRPYRSKDTRHRTVVSSGCHKYLANRSPTSTDFHKQPRWRVLHQPYTYPRRLTQYSYWSGTPHFYTVQYSINHTFDT
jgi:hypothetical protein